MNRHARFVRGVCIWGLGVGLIGMVTERILWVGWNYDVFGPHGGRPLLEFVVNLAFTYGSTALSLGYAATIVLMSRDRRWRSIVAPLAPVGRMALTAYLTQTLVFTTIFYGYALGLASWMGPAAVSGLAVVIFSAQILACGWWLRRYRFGPAEWAWRAMTYLQLPPMRARPSSIEGGAG